MRGWFCPSTIQVTGQSCLTGFKAMTRYSPCKCYKDITLITPAPPPPKFKLQLPKTTSQTKRGDEVAGVFFFFFYFSFLFIFFGAVAFHCQFLKDFSLCVKKTKQKQTWILKSIHVSTLHGLWVHSSKKTKSVCKVWLIWTVLPDSFNTL